MLNRNFAINSAQISRMTMPDITPQKQVDLVDVLRQTADDYYKYDALRRNNEEKDRIRGLEQNLADAIEGGDETAINNAYAQLDPSGYMEYLNRIKANREASDLDFERQKELLNLQNQNSMGLERLKAELGLGGGVNINLNPFEKKRIEKIASNIDENIAASQSRIDDYNRMEQLLQDEDVSTGGIVGAIKDNISPAFLNEKEQELQAIIKKIVPQMRPAGSGTTSDRDMAIFEKATAGFSKEKNANLNIVRGRRAADENAIAREELRADWVGQGGSLTDFDRQWRRYLNANPIFKDANGNLNTDRIGAYDWFNGVRTNQGIDKDNDPLGIL